MSTSVSSTLESTTHHHPLTLTLYGSRVCEDTAITRDRLRSLHIPFIEHMKEDDDQIRARLVGYNAGYERTPTLVFGQDEFVLVEPTLDELEDALTRAHYEFHAPRVVEFRSPLSSRLVPYFELPTVSGEPLDTSQLRGRYRTVLFFAHDINCRVCQGYAKQLAKQHTAFAEFEARVVLVVNASIDAATHWANEFAPAVITLADANGAVKRAYANYFETVPTYVQLLILDKFAAPREGLFAAEAGGVLSLREIKEWLRVLDCECSE